MSSASASGSLYLRESSGDAQYSLNNSSWTTFSWPLSITNTTTGTPLVVYFTTDMTITTANGYFNCATANIQFGSQSTKADGTRPIITIDNVTNYPGLVRNGTAVANGNNSIKIFNLGVEATGTTTLLNESGWLTQEYFSKAANNNWVVACYSTGTITAYSGGIVGRHAANASGVLKIIGCSSSGAISGTYSGGIIGAFAANASGNITISNCYSSGAIGTEAGGIGGAANAYVGGSLTITNCYSTGTIGTGGGGIVGSRVCEQNGTCTISNCYSRGSIAGTAGGIVGMNAGGTVGGQIGTSTVSNCYSTGSIGTNSGGIYGDAYQNSTASACYTSGDSATDIGGIYAGTTRDNLVGAIPPYNYSEANDHTSGWKSDRAVVTLLGIPSPVVGTSWVDLTGGADTPYELRNMGYSAYTAGNISGPTSGNYSLTTSFDQTIIAGNTTDSSIVTGHTFSILSINGSTPSLYGITIDASTGQLSVSLGTIGTFVIIIRDTFNPYAITIFNLISNVDPCSCYAATNSAKGLNYNMINSVQTGNRLLVERFEKPLMQFPSHTAYLKYKMAAAAKIKIQPS